MGTRERGIMLGVLCLLLGTPGALAGTTERVSVGTAGHQADDESQWPSISADGRFVAFESWATNLVAGDTNSLSDVFVRDRLLGTAERVSVSSGGAQGNGPSRDPVISADGRFVAFPSHAGDLVPGDTNGVPDVFVRDRVLGTTERVSVSSAGEQANAGGNYWKDTAISADGRFVVFACNASNLVADDTNGCGDIFVRDRLLDTTERVSVATSGEQGNGSSGYFCLSISPDGRFVSFPSYASNLVPGDSNGEKDIFLRDRLLGITERVSISSAGTEADGPCYGSSVSPDGRYVVFDSYAGSLVAGDTDGYTDLFVRDRQAGLTSKIVESGHDPVTAAEGRYVALWQGEGHLSEDTVCVYDMVTGTLEAVSVSESGAVCHYSHYPSISGDGRFVAFQSSSPALVSEDTNSCVDIFVHDRHGASAQPDSPYPTADDWATGRWHAHRGQLHAHYMPDAPVDGGYYVEPDGQWTGVRLGPFLSPTSLLEAYLDHEYDFCAVTEHHPDGKFDRYTWPQVFDDPAVSGIVSMVGSAEDTQPPGGTHILGIGFGQGIEEERMGAVFSEGARLENITSNGGFAIAAHPDAAQYRWGSGTLGSLRGEYDGIEIYNYLVGYGAFLDTYKAVWQETEDENAAYRAAAQARFDQAHAVERWDPVLQIGDARSRSVWGTAGDDFTPYWLGDSLMDHACVVVWTESLAPDREEIKEALRVGRFYACKGGSEAPTIMAYWVDPENHTIAVKLSEPYHVTFVRGRSARRPVDTAPVDNGNGTYTASYRYLGDDVYVRTEVRDERGNTSWLQPTWIDKTGGVSATAPPLAGRLAAADVEPLAVYLEGAQLAISLPQSGLVGVDAALVPGDQRPAAPPMGYVGLCYEFTPDVWLDGVNTLTLEYLPDSVRGFPASALAVYRYDTGSEAWQRQESSVDENATSVTATIQRLGTFTVSAEEPDDVAAPSVSIMYPAPDAEITEPTIVTADATDDQGVVNIQFLLDGWPLDVDEWGGDGWTAGLDPANYTSGTKVLSVIAEDEVGNAATAEIPVSVAGLMLAPVVTITAPAEGQVLWGDLVVSGEWSGQLPMSLGLLTLDHDALAMAGPSDGPFEMAIGILPEQAGAGTVEVTGFDIYGNRATAEVSVVLKVFPDVPMGHWARSHIYAVARADVVQGYDDGLYHDDWAVTRGQMAVYVARGLVGGEEHVPTGPAEATFPDVPPDHWAYNHVECAVASSVVAGYEDGSYHPEVVVDRGQMAVFIARAMVAPAGDLGVPAGPEEPTFADVTDDGDWAWCYDHVEHIASEGVASGYGDGLYHPEYTCTRDQMAVYVARAFRLAK